jgi:plasmid stabilization system protein ParE
MAERPARPNSLATFTLSSEADLDLSATYNYTVSIWDSGQAERYVQYLKSVMLVLSCDPAKGRRIAGRPGLRSYIARWKRAKHGHRVVYEQTPTGIFILRILHTAMNLPDHL